MTVNPRPVVIIRTYQSNERVIVATSHAHSLRKALEDFFKEYLKPAGCTDPVYVGNTLSVSAGRHTRKYEAQEA